MAAGLFQEDNWSHIVSLGGGVHFDGVTTLFNGSLACGNSPIISASYWYRILGDQSGNRFWEIDPFDFTDGVEFWSEVNKPNVFFAQGQPDDEDAPGSLQFGTTGLAVLGSWHHVAWTCNTAGGEGAKTGFMAIDRVVQSLALISQGVGFSVPIGGRPFIIGGEQFAHNIVGDVAEFWFAVGQGLPALDKFITEDGAPVSLGEHGELPTGIAPTIYGHGGAGTFLRPNLGTGGAFSLSGALSDALGAPHL